MYAKFAYANSGHVKGALESNLFIYLLNLFLCVVWVCVLLFLMSIVIVLPETLPRAVSQPIQYEIELLIVADYSFYKRKRRVNIQTYMNLV